MSPLVIAFAAVVAGLALLVFGADRFVDAAAALARRLRLNPVVVGALVIGFGTSLPEMLVSAMAALEGAPGLAIGNAVGSNIANVALVLGASAIIAPLTVDAQTRRCELPIMLAAVGLTWLLLAGGELGTTQGMVLLLMLAGALVWITRVNLATRGTPGNAGGEDDASNEVGGGKLAFNLVAGLVALLGGSRLLVVGATDIALVFGVPEVVIGLTIVAVGTSLPELAAAIASVLRREVGLAIGNVVGSNIFNLLAVLPMPALLAPSVLPAGMLARDYTLMAILCAVVAFCAYRRGTLGRVAGGLFVLTFAAYQLAVALGWGAA